MSKLRSVNTHFWSDNYVIELDPIEKLIFLYLLTNQHTNMLGVYELHIRKVAFDTGNPLPRVKEAFESFEEDGKIAYVDGYVIMKNFLKHQNLNINMQKSAINSFNRMPLEVKRHRFCKPLAKALEGFIKGSQSLRKEEYELEYELEEEKELEIEEYVEPDGSDEYPDVCEYLNEAEGLANHLLKRIIQWKPDHKFAKSEPARRSWILEIERMIRLDGRKPEAIEGVIDYTFTKSTKQAQFWAKNIWSGNKLRNKYDRLVTDYKDEQKLLKQENGKVDIEGINNDIDEILADRKAAAETTGSN